MLRKQPRQLTIRDADLDEPGPGAVKVEMVVTGLCHSDYHMITGDTPLEDLPYCAGHEGGAIVRKVGSGVNGLEAGDHIVTTFVPSCERHTWCVLGRADATHQILDRSSYVKVRKDVPLDVACLVGCGAPTGFGSASCAGNVWPGDVVIVAGHGGVGMNAVRGAHLSGARRVIAVDTAPFKREMAPQFGATDVFDNMADVTRLAKSLTNGQHAEVSIVTVGVITRQDITDGFNAIRKAGTVVVTGQGTMGVHPVDIDPFEIPMYQKRIQRVLCGTASPQEIIPTLIDLDVDGRPTLDEPVTWRHSLDQINDEVYQDIVEGKNIRGVVVYN